VNRFAILSYAKNLEEVIESINDNILKPVEAKLKELPF
jgi:hypothetical protein